MRGYDKGESKIENLPDMRWHLFSRYSVDASKLPPTKAALKYRIYRCHYISLVLKSCDMPLQHLPDPTGFGWENSNGNLIPIMTDQLPAPVGLIELCMCSCKGICDTARCSCHKNKLVCTEMCKCSNECINDGRDDAIEINVTDSEDEEDFDESLHN